VARVTGEVALVCWHSRIGLVPEKGLEPSRPCGHWNLNANLRGPDATQGQQKRGNPALLLAFNRLLFRLNRYSDRYRNVSEAFGVLKCVDF